MQTCFPSLLKRHRQLLTHETPDPDLPGSPHEEARQIRLWLWDAHTEANANDHPLPFKPVIFFLLPACSILGWVTDRSACERCMLTSND